MDKSQRRIEIVCPHCQATLLLDPKTGLVLHSEEKKVDYSLEKGLKEVKARKEKADQLFEKAFRDERRRHDSLEEKFREALESKDELDEPVRPWDID